MLKMLKLFLCLFIIHLHFQNWIVRLHFFFLSAFGTECDPVSIVFLHIPTLTPWHCQWMSLRWLLKSCLAKVVLPVVQSMSENCREDLHRRTRGRRVPLSVPSIGIAWVSSFETQKTFKESHRSTLVQLQISVNDYIHVVKQKPASPSIESHRCQASLPILPAKTQASSMENAPRIPEMILRKHWKLRI